MVVISFAVIFLVALVAVIVATAVPASPPKLPSQFMITERTGPVGVPPVVVVVTTFWSQGKALRVEPTPFGMVSTLSVRSPQTAATWTGAPNANTCSFSCLDGQVCGSNGACSDGAFVGVRVSPNATLAGTCNGPSTQLWTASCPSNSCTFLWCYNGAQPLWYSLAVGGGPPANTTVVQWMTRKIDPSVFTVPTNCTCASN